MHLKKFSLKLTSIFQKYSIPLGLGIVAFLAVLGYKRLIPWNIAWLAQGENQDMIQHYFGWEFFRNSGWNIPLGENPKYGIDIRNSIIYTDSIPLLAFIFKPFAYFLPETFQYFGIWLLICFVMQSIFGWRLISIFIENTISRVAVTLLFLFAPIFLERLNVHFALSGQFIVLAALGNYFTKKKNSNGLTWRLTLVFALLIHAYLFLMVLVIWIAAVIRSTNRANDLKKGFLTAFILIATASLSGYFVIPSGGEIYSAHYGIFRWNMASLFYPDGWSNTLKNVLEYDVNLENSSYLGLGVIFLLFFALPQIQIAKSFMKTYWSLFFAMIFLLTFAISNNVGLGPLKFQFSLPASILKVFDLFRASGRMIWPIIYALILTGAVLLHRRFKIRTSTFILIVAAILQIIDTQIGWKELNHDLHVGKSLGMKIDSRWNEIAKDYKEVVEIPKDNQSENWLTMGQIASKFGLATNIVYLSRVSSEDVKQMAKEIEEEVKTCNLSESRIYILSDKELLELCEAKRRGNVLISRINDLNVVRLDRSES